MAGHEATLDSIIYGRPHHLEPTTLEPVSPVATAVKQSSDVTMSKAAPGPILPRRPKLPEPDSPRAKAPSLTERERAARLARVMDVPVPVEEELDEKATNIEAFQYVLTLADNLRRHGLQHAVASRHLNNDRLDRIEKKQQAITIETEEKVEEVSTTDWRQDMLFSLLNAAQIVIGGYFFQSPNSQMAGLAMITSGAVGIGAQVAKSLGYDKKITGAIALVASSIGFMSGTAAYAMLQGNRAQMLMKVISTTKALIQLFTDSQRGIIEGDISQLKAEDARLNGAHNAQAKKLEGSIKKLKLKNEQVARAMQSYLEQKAEVMRRMAAAAA